jgi:sugar lactone lactonase YvrE
VALLIAAGAALANAQAPSYTFLTLAGAPPGSPFWYAHALAVGSDGMIYVYDSSHFVIRKVTPAGQVSIFAGKLDNYGSTDGVGTDARFGLGYGIAVSSQGNVYVADTFHGLIRRITPDGTVTTLAAAGFQMPAGIAADAAGNVYVGDWSYTVRKITPDGVVSTLAGLAGSSGNVDGVGSAARFGAPNSLAVDAIGTVYVSDAANHSIRKVTPDGSVTTLAGLAGPPAFVDGVGSAARFTYPGALTIDGSGTLLVGDACAIRTVTPDGTVTTIAGGPSTCGTTDGGSGSAAQLEVDGPNAIGIDARGTVYFLQANQEHPALRMLTPDRVVTTLLPDNGSPGLVDGPGQTARFSYPAGVAFDSGWIYEVDAMTIRTITAAGLVSSLQLIDAARGVTVGAGDLAYATVGCGIQTITAAGTVTTLAGTVMSVGPDACGAIDGTAGTARFNRPTGVAIDSAGTVYVADTGNNTIRTVTAQGMVTTLAGLAGQTGSTDGTGSTARFNAPAGLAIDRNGTLYVADSGNHTIRMVTQTGVVTTVAGRAGQSGSTDGARTTARFNGPYGVATDGSGNLYVADTGNSTIRMIAPNGTVTTLGGVAGSPGHADGTGAAATFSSPKGIAVDDTGTLYVADTDNHTIRLGLIGTATAPVITTQPAAQSAAAGQDAQFTVAGSGFPSPSYQWQVSSNGGSSWAALIYDSWPYTGTFTPTLTVKQATTAQTGYQFRCVLTNVAGTATSSAASLTVYGINLTPTSLSFGAVKAGAAGDLTAVTPAQNVTVTFLGPSSSWTVTADQPWIQITGGAGTGAGGFNVAIINPDNVIGGSTSLTASVTATSGNGLQATLTVALKVRLTGTGVPLIGQIDTPVQNATGVAGSIAVTGWALDDVGVASVQIFRNCLAFENQANCQVVGGYNVVYIGDAVFLSGARPDVEGGFSTYPHANRAGWGFLLLTNFLPHVTGQRQYGGQGDISLYAFATDVEGHTTLLGRAWRVAGTLDGDHVPTTITLANDTMARPFGVIDTPAQGGTVSQTLANSGWALTPDSNEIADNSDIFIPTDGSTIAVYVDGVLVGHAAYNQCRGTVGNPVPAGLYCNDDVSNVFGNLAPQPVFTERTWNPTRYRNLDAGRAPIAAFEIDTTALTNGLHTIGWTVTDSAGRVDGIGSRFFTVFNSGASSAVTAQEVAGAAGRPSTSAGAVGPASARGERNGVNRRDGDRASDSVRPERPSATAAASKDDLTALQVAPAQPRANARALGQFALSSADVFARTGFDPRAPLEPLVADDDGVRRVQIAELSRLELQLGAGIQAGYLVANGTLRDLPPGSRLDAATGRFTWMPGPGYLGTYRLAFVCGDDQILVDVTIAPPARPARRPDGGTRRRDR